MSNKNKKEEPKLTNPICEVEIDGKMALVSLYDDLPHFEYDTTIDKLKSSNNKLKILIQELEQHIRRLEKEHSQLKTTNGILSKNIGSLYKTACREIKRKDIMINELRNSCRQIKPPPVSKMFSSSNLPLGKTQLDKLSNEKQGTLQPTGDEGKSKTINKNDTVNITSIVVKPNYDIPKTVYYKRLCQKLTKQNQNILSKNMAPKYLDTCTITSEKTQDKNVCLNNDENVLKELDSSVLCDDPRPVVDSTLIICEPDLPPSDSDQSTTSSVIQCKNAEKGKENISVESYSLKLRPKMCKKKFVITPASIGVLNISNETSKCIEKLRKNKNLDLQVVDKISNSLETKLIKDPIECTQPMFIKELNSNINAEIDGKHVPKTDNIVHKQKTHLKTNEAPSMSNEHESSSQHLKKNSQLKYKLNDVGSFPKNIEIKANVINKMINIENKTNYPNKVTTVRKSFSVVTSSLSDGKDLNMPTKNDECSFKNNEKEPSQSEEKNNQLNCLLNDVEGSPNTTAVPTNLFYKTKQSKNNKTKKNDPAKVTRLKKSSPLISSDDNKLNMSTKYVKCSSKNNEIESSQTEEMNNQLKYVLNDNVENSSKNTAVHINLSNKISTPSKNIETGINDTFKVTAIKKSSRVISLGLSGDCDMSTKYINCSSINSEKESSKNKDKNKQLKCITNGIDESCLKNIADETNVTDIICIPSENIETVNCKLDNVESSSKNTAVHTNLNKISTPSKNIETGKNDIFKVTKIIKSPRVISLGPSGDNNGNISTKYINCSSINNEKESSKSKDKNNQLKCITNDIDESCPKNTANETNVTDIISIPSKNIETRKNDTFKVTKIIKSSRVISLGPSGNNDGNTSTKYVRCSSINNEKESSKYIEKNNQLKCISNCTIESSPKNTADESKLTSKISLSCRSIETGNNDIFKVTTVRKSPKSICLSQSNDRGPNVAVMHVQCSAINTENKSSYLPKQTNGQLNCNIINSPHYNLAAETSLANKMSTPSRNIEDEQVALRKSTDKNHLVKVTSVKKSSRAVVLSPSVDNNFNSLTECVKCSSMDAKKESSSRPNEKNNQLGFKLNDDIKSSTNNISVETNIVNQIFTPTIHCEVEQVPISKKRKLISRNDCPVETEVNKPSGSSVEYESSKSTKKVQCLPINHDKDSSISLKHNDNQLTCKPTINKCKSSLKKLTESNDQTKVLSTSTDFDNKSVCSNLSQDENNQEFKKGRRVQFITIQDHYSEPLPSFNGAKKTEIDVSKNSVHIEKEVESSSRFYVPQVKRRRLSNYGSTNL